jgi:hypothetical protein
MPDLIKAASYAGLLFSGLGAIALAMIHASKRIGPEPTSDKGDRDSFTDSLVFHDGGK